MRIFAALATLGLLMAATPALAGNILLNGSFEDGRSSIGGFLNTSNSADIDHWDIDAGNLDYIGTYWGAQDGSRSLDLNGTNSAVTISQNFATTIGQSYLVSFWMSGNPAGLPLTKTLEVAAAGTTAQFSQARGTGFTTQTMGWAEKTWSFVATGATTTLSFRSLDSGSYGPALDNVSVTAAVPLPPAAWMGLGLLGGLGLLRRRRRRTS